jgi:hypothetical protein
MTNHTPHAAPNRPHPARRALTALLLLSASLLLTANALADAVAAIAAKTKERWFVVSVDGRKIGHQHQRTENLLAPGGAAVLRQTEVLDIVIERGAEKTALYTQTVTEETASGTPLSFAVRYRASNVETVMHGKIAADRTVTVTQGDSAAPVRTFVLAPDALFPAALLRALIASGLKPGSTQRFTAFDPTVMLSFPVDTRVLALEKVITFEGEKQLRRVEQTMRLPGTEITSRGVVDGAFSMYQLDTPMGAMTIRMTASTRAAALASNESSNFFIEQFSRSPSPISAAQSRGALRYQLRLKTPTASLPPQTDEQQVTKTDASHISVLVCTRCGSAPAAEKTAAQLALAKRPSVWLQSEDADLKAAALKQAQTQTGEAAKMLALEEFVALHIAGGNLGTGYASAEEAFRTKVGDCTEHALLLAAMGRAVGIPTRVVTGLAYAPEYLGKRDIFVPHAWMQAYVAGRWRSFDSALRGFNAGHIALAVTDGDASSSFIGMTLLGNIVIERVEAVALPAARP